MKENPILKRFLKQTSFVSEQDYRENLEFIVPENFNFAYDVVDAWAEVEPERVALLWANEEGVEHRLTFADLKQQSDQAAAYLSSLGIGRGDMVMLIEKRRLEWWITMLALHKLGAVPIPATHMLTHHDIVYRNNAASVKGIICVGEPYVLGEVQKAMPDSPTVDVLISIGPDVPEGFHDWHAEVSKVPAFSRPCFVNANDDPMILYFTSGTTGKPKMVAHDFLYALGHLTTGVFWHNLTPGSIHLTLADTGWGKAVWGKFYGQWFAGACVFVYDHEKFSAEAILQQMSKYKVTSFCAPPTVYRFLVREDFSRFDLSSLRYCTTAGEALNAAVYEKFRQQTGICLMEGFGQTETTMTLGTFPWMKPKPGSMGKPNAQYEIALLRPDLSPCEDGEKGEIAVRLSEGRKPIGLFKEYFRDSKTTSEVCHDGYYFTGDMAWRDKDGYYWFEGRADDVIKSSGYRIGPFEVESALMTHPAVVECAITGVPDEIRGMVVKATIVVGEEWKDRDLKELAAELQEHVKQVTAPYKYPRIVEFVDELPKTISGKICRVEIREKKQHKMKSFLNVEDLGSLKEALQEAVEIKTDRYKYDTLGKNKTLLMVFFNNSLRTRLSTQKAAMNLGMNVIVLDVNAGAWKLETERGVIMDGDKSEHLLEAIPVMGSFCDVIGIRSFAGLTDREYDYAEKVYHQFKMYSGKPVFAMETATVHPLQAFADLFTIKEYWAQATKRPKVVLTWAPHPKALPQAVPNSFAQWILEADRQQVPLAGNGTELGMDFVITHPEGYELDPLFCAGATIEYDQRKAFEGADFIYAKNWSCPGVTGGQDNYGKILSKDMSWTVDAEHMSWTNNAHFMHCLPVRRGMIVTDEVIEAPTSIVIPEAANREISATVVLKRILQSL